MAKRPGNERPEEELLKKEELPEKSGIGRRAFVKLAGTAGVAVTAVAGMLAGEGLLKASPTETETQDAPDAATAKLVGPGPVRMTLKINNKTTKVVLEPRVTLLDALRDHIYLTGAKKVCDRATCGACTVIINGMAMYSCTVLAIDVAERPGTPAASIETIEGLAPEGKLHAVSSAFVDNDGQQCGFCTPGFVMSAKAYIDKHPKPTYEQVKSALGGNLCRCGTYMGVRHAVVQAAGMMASGKGGNA